eukprot:7348652-Pyramimonas_sp.AAC.1
MGPRDAAPGVADGCKQPHWSFRWSFLWGHGTLHWVWQVHAGNPSGAFGGRPYKATKRCTGCGGRTRAPPLAPSMELPSGPRNTAL